jgi:DNA-binding transcriptional regulator/RsmH inhibitor MraZ
MIELVLSELSRRKSARKQLWKLQMVRDGSERFSRRLHYQTEDFTAIGNGRVLVPWGGLVALGFFPVWIGGFILSWNAEHFAA